MRDNIHSLDVARCIEAFYEAPSAGAVFNLGGGRANSVSILEAFDRVADLTGKAMRYRYVDQPRAGITSVIFRTSHGSNESFQGGILQSRLMTSSPRSSRLGGAACWSKRVTSKRGSAPQGQAVHTIFVLTSCT